MIAPDAAGSRSRLRLMVGREHDQHRVGERA
jgi:hypothetical protein